MAHDFDLFVIGGGSGGVRCARIAASHGARVGIAEERHWGGTCVNVGCVPKKILVQASEYGDYAADARGFGWDMEVRGHDWATLIAHKDAEITRLEDLYARLLGDSGVRHYKARATFLDAHTLDVGGERVSAERIVVATGGRPRWPDIEGASLGIVSDQAFHLPRLPRRVLIVGGGYIGVEFAGIFAGLGAEVDLLFRQHHPLRGFDQDLREALDEAIVARGIRIHRSVKLHKVEAAGEARRMHLTNGQVLETDLVFFAVGRMPNTEGLGLDRAGIETDADGAVVVDTVQQTSAAHVWAIGDVSNALNLTPVAIAEGHRLAERLFGPGPREWDFATVPKAVFFTPPLASAGLIEAEAAARGPTDIYLTRFTPMRHVIGGRGRRTLMKLVVDQASRRVLGAHMFGDDAPEIMQGLAAAMTAGITKEVLDRTVGLHPSSAEEFVTMRTRTRVAGEAAQ